jgi:hypothetical protein
MVSRQSFLASFRLPKPDDGLLELIESAHLPAVKVAEEGEKAGAMVRISRIKHRETMLFSESQFVEYADKLGEILQGEDWLGAYVE